MPINRQFFINMVTTCSASYEKMAFQLAVACFVRNESMCKGVFASKIPPLHRKYLLNVFVEDP